VEVSELPEPSALRVLGCLVLRLELAHRLIFLRDERRQVAGATFRRGGFRVGDGRAVGRAVARVLPAAA
jgi:hypothetical protein